MLAVDLYSGSVPHDGSARNGEGGIRCVRPDKTNVQNDPENRPRPTKVYDSIQTLLRVHALTTNDLRTS